MRRVRAGAGVVTGRGGKKRNGDHQYPLTAGGRPVGGTSFTILPARHHETVQVTVIQGPFENLLQRRRLFGGSRVTPALTGCEAARRLSSPS